MTLTVRNSAIALTTIVAAVLGFAACNDSNNPPAQSDNSGGTTTTTTTTGTGGSATGAGGTTTTTTTTTTAQGGSTAAGGATTTATDAGGTTAAGGATGASGNTFNPLCAGLTTAAGPSPTKNGACTATDPQLCYKTCGPQSKGFKSETCTAGVYVEPSNTCEYPPGDYSCFKIPAVLPDATTCGLTTTPPKASDPCTAPDCTLCSLNGAYLDSGGANKVGYCVCVKKADGSGSWSCAGANIWPCPSMGC